jgi:hypothetical protein
VVEPLWAYPAHTQWYALRYFDYAIEGARRRCAIDEEGYGCREKQGCLRQAQAPLFVAT